nr:MULTISPECIES: hypothetical protein [Actinomycetes]
MASGIDAADVSPVVSMSLAAGTSLARPRFAFIRVLIRALALWGTKISMSSRATPDRSMTLDSALGRVIAAQRNTRVPCMATTMRPTGSVSESFDWNSSASMYSGMS